MPPQQSDTKVQWNAVTWYSKLFAILLFISLVCGAFYFGMWYQEQIATPTEAAKTISETGADYPSGDDTKTILTPDIAAEYISSHYRVLGVKDNPFAPYTLIIATERRESGCGTSENAPSCNNDTGCGSIYTSPNCYFFIEPQYHADADKFTRFVAKWREKGGLEISTIKFLDADTVQFQSFTGDGGFSGSYEWSLNLKTGTITKLSEKETEVQ